MIERFIQGLLDAQIALDHKQIAEVLWLARIAREQVEVDAQPARASKRRVKKVRTDSRREAATAGEGQMTEACESVALHSAPGLGANAMEGLKGSRVRIPGESALADPLSISRALRPFTRRIPSRQQRLLDEEETVRQSAEHKCITPVFRPTPERWFDVILLVEDAISMSVWRQSVRELEALFETLGAFRDVRVLKFKLVKGELENESFEISEPDGGRLSPAALKSADSRRILFLLSDCVTPIWSNGALSAHLRDWMMSMPVVVWQMLGERLWRHSALGAPAFRVKSLLPGVANRQLSVEYPWWWRPQAPDETGLPLPIVNFEAEFIADWAAMTMGRGSCRAFLMRSDANRADASAALPERIPPEIRLERFRELVSPEAFELAVFLSVSHLMLPLMRLIQRAMIDQPTEHQLSEVLLGGILIHRQESGRDDPHFDFHSQELRVLFQQRLKASEFDRIVRVISRFIAHRLNRPFDLWALIENPEGEERLEPWVRPFAEIARGLFDRIVRPNSPPPSTQRPQPRPVDDPSRVLPVTLREFSFTSVTLSETGKEVDRRAGTAFQFEELLSPRVKLAMVEIPGGPFKMGTPDQDVKKEIAEYTRYGSERKDAERWVNWERPQHEVHVPSFFIGKFAITQSQWRIVARWPKVERDLKANPSHFKGADRPVESISWFDAKEFCARLAKKTGRAYRLPTEAEWEYACRAGTVTPFAFGETITPEIVNYDGNYPYAKAVKGPYREQTVPVGSLGIANDFGLFDMHGNVWEWCEDAFFESYEGAPSDGSSRLSEDDSSLRVLRGGSWGDYGWICRSAYRNWYVPGGIYLYRGVRVVVSSRTLRP